MSDEYSAATQSKLDTVETEYQVNKGKVENEHRVLGALVRKGEIPDKELRDFERQIFDPSIAVLSRKRVNDKKDILANG